jgi:hypothetical protein
MLLENEVLTHLPLERGTFVGPAKVLQAANNRVQLEFPDQLPWATLALAFPYQVSAGDVVLAIGQGENWYVIGVIQGIGKTRLIVQGDFEVLAPTGSIRLVAGRGVLLKSPVIKILGTKVELIARRMFERFTDATRVVKGLFQLRADRIRAEAARDYRVNANRIIERAEDEVIIDGTKIHLG